MKPLYLDHFYFVVPPAMHLALKNFFSSFPSVESSVVHSDHGSWNGIYAFTERGGFLEFLEESARDLPGTHGVAVSRFGDEAGLHDLLVAKNPQINWGRHERRRPDGSQYYTMSYPEDQPTELFLWGMEYFNDNARRMRAKGDVKPNAIKSVLSAEFLISEDLFARVEEYSAWTEAKLVSSDKVQKVLSFAQKSGADFRLTLRPTKNPNSQVRVDIEVEPDHLPKLSEHREFTATLVGNVLTLCGPN